MWKVNPAVFALGREYQIMQYVDCEAMMWVRVGDKIYYDAVNGILRSQTSVHRVTVPMEVLDREKRYTVYLQKVIDRKPYFPENAEPQSKEFSFRPLPDGVIRAYHIADAHDHVKEPVAAARAYGDFDFLILNGDIPNHCGFENNAETIYKIASELTDGSIPVVFSRGNHDMRGRYAENFAANTPCCNGNSYYTFRMGKIWGMVLDCGEDKPDTDPEYGSTICCHAFRQQETAFIRQAIADARTEYAAEGIAVKMVISHIPFTMRHPGVFDIETDTYAEWTKLLADHVKPDLILCGHMHEAEIIECKDEKDAFGQPCRVVVGSAVKTEADGKLLFTGAGLSFENDRIEVRFTDNALL
ncbi:MAG: metallophosphoesterase [Lachnospiraceae bacterium]|nr:metallophosphoesterase [Lachnospiraceae bacterium]